MRRMEPLSEAALANRVTEGMKSTQETTFKSWTSFFFFFSLAGITVLLMETETEEKGMTMKRYIQATLAVMGLAFALLFGVAMLPLLVALVGSLAGVLVAFSPVVIVIVVIVILANTVYKEK